MTPTLRQTAEESARILNKASDHLVSISCEFSSTPEEVARDLTNAEIAILAALKQVRAAIKDVDAAQTAVVADPGYKVEASFTKRFTSGLLEGMTVPGTLRCVSEEDALAWADGIRANRDLNYVLESFNIRPL